MKNLQLMTARKKFSYLIPLLIFNGFEQAFVCADYTKVLLWNFSTIVTIVIIIIIIIVIIVVIIIIIVVVVIIIIIIIIFLYY